MAGEALRVLAVAREPAATLEDAERELTFLGLVGMIDPPRPEAESAVADVRAGRHQAVMITGDHPLTARPSRASWACSRPAASSPARSSRPSDDDGARPRGRHIEVYARVSPAHKLRVVTACRSAASRSR